MQKFAHGDRSEVNLAVMKEKLYLCKRIKYIMNGKNNIYSTTQKWVVSGSESPDSHGTEINPCEYDYLVSP